jgi:hypothetical protein
MKCIILFLLITSVNTGSFSQPTLTKGAQKRLNSALEETFQTPYLSFLPDKGVEGLYQIIIRDMEKGHALFRSAKGRYEEFDFLVLFSTEWTILKVEILVYRSDHGYEIMNKNWLSQFNGKTGCELTYGNEIDAISGATLSGNSLTETISKFCESRNP